MRREGTSMSVYEYLIERLEEDGALHFTLIDPDPRKMSAEEAGRLAAVAKEAGTDAIMIGGSLGVSESCLDEVVRAVKRATGLPVILFPGNLTGISREADAIWFMSLLNSESTYYVIEAQALGAVLVKRYGIEPIPMGYIVVEPGEAVGFIGRARPIPVKHPEIAAAYALAAEYLGMKFVYLERGSGAPEPLPPEFVKVVASFVSIPIIVGGGIRSGEHAARLIEAGASAVVTGTIAEERADKLKEIVKAVKEAGQRRRGGALAR